MTSSSNSPEDTTIANVCGVLVHIRPRQSTEMEQRMLQIPGLEIHASTPEGKLVVTVEADDYGSAGDALMALNTLPGVLSASLIYHHAEETKV